jgi:diguanylate cyclase (GGDEF)-like protein
MQSVPDSNQREKILIVDDNKQNIDLLLDLFKDDYKVAVAITPERALKAARGEPRPDIILLDILMPGMDGYEVCSLLKQDEATQHIPIIFVTAVSEVMDEAKGFALGGVDYITKPFHPPMVKARVQMQLNLKRKQELLEEFAFIDALTEIPNRRRLEEVLDREWHRASRSGKPLSLLFLDIDHFKQYNDSYGHGRGDEALRRMAQEIQRNLKRAGDFVARYGGEEFVVVLPYTDEETANSTARMLSEAVDGLHIVHESSPVAPHLTVSIGVVPVQPCTGQSIEQVMQILDKAMYEAKSEGRHRIKMLKL